jgi:cell division protein FtsB
MRPATAFLGTLAVIALLLAPSVRAWVQQRSALAAESSDVERIGRELNELQAQNKRWDDPAYIPAQARARLRFQMPGERSFVVIDDRVRVPVSSDPTEVVADQVERSDEAWFSRMWDSITIAGRTELPQPTAVPSPPNGRKP